MPKTYTITFNANGGSGAPGNQTKTEGVNLTLSSTKPTKEGYIFNGWKDSDGNSYSAGGTYTANKATTLTAQWKAVYTIIFNTNGMSGSFSNLTFEGTSEKKKMSTTIPTKSGVHFIGWSSQSKYSPTNKLIATQQTYNSMSESVNPSIADANWTINDYVSKSGGSLSSTNTLTLYAQYVPDKTVITESKTQKNVRSYITKGDTSVMHTYDSNIIKEGTPRGESKNTYWLVNHTNTSGAHSASVYIKYPNSVVRGDEKYDLIIYPVNITNHSWRQFYKKDYFMPFVSTNPGIAQDTLIGTTYYAIDIYVAEHTSGDTVGTLVDWTGCFGVNDLDKEECWRIQNNCFKLIHKGDKIDTGTSSLTGIDGSAMTYYIGTAAASSNNDLYSVLGILHIPTSGTRLYYGRESSSGKHYPCGSPAVIGNQLDMYQTMKMAQHSINYYDVDNNTGTRLGRPGIGTINEMNYASGYDMGNATYTGTYYPGYSVCGQTVITVDENHTEVIRYFK